MVPVKNYRKNHNNVWFPSFFDDFFNDDFVGVPVAKQFSAPAVNIKETEKEYEIQVAAPGMAKEDFKINIDDNNELVISFEKKSKSENNDENARNEKNEKKATWLRREFSYSSYSQAFQIPEDVDEKKISAKMENGVLVLALPKKEVAEQTPSTRQISIE